MAREFKLSDSESTLFDALLRASHRFGARKPILEDQERRPLS
jgi:acyl-[acyl-carrier-protein]-phospholipid O-acyltransferase/long-chain-fatty-acid--[acyl-carrier-protein] ligase